MPRPICASIDLNALEHNLKVLRKKAGNRFMWGVVKANAYGHGLKGMLESFDLVDGLAVLDTNEACSLREWGWTKPILLIEGFFTGDDLPLVQKYGMETLVHADWQIEELKKISLDFPVKVHIKINSGMNRLGFLPERAFEVKKTLQNIPNVEVVDFVTHFANSETSYSSDGCLPVSKQLSNINNLRETEESGCYSNSGAILWHPDTKDHAVRAGIAMYGISPDSSVSSEELDLKPVMTLAAAILTVQELKAGDAVGYGSKFVADKPMRTGVVACGYADGYPRQRSENRYVLVNGKKAKVIGSVSMDMMNIDLTDIPQAKAGDMAQLWGKELPVNEVAALHDTIGYELLANLNQRVPRAFVRS